MLDGASVTVMRWFDKNLIRLQFAALRSSIPIPGKSPPLDAVIGWWLNAATSSDSLSHTVTTALPISESATLARSDWKMA